MKSRTWAPKLIKPTPRPKIPADVRAAVDVKITAAIAGLKRRCAKPKSPRFNWRSDVIARWHREALYIVAVMRTPHGRPPSFETHLGRIEHAGDGVFRLSLPMRRGWYTAFEDATLEECLSYLAKFASM